MRKICAVIVAFLLCCLVAPSVTFAAGNDDVTIDKTILFDDQGISISVTGFSTFADSITVYFQIENNTDQEIKVTDDYFAVNGFMISEMSLRSAVGAQETAKANANYMAFMYEDVGLDTVQEIETVLSIESTTSDDIAIKTEPIRIKTSAYGSFEQKFDDSGEVLYDADGIRIINQGIYTSDYLTGKYIFIENDTDRPLQLISTENKVNGVLVTEKLTYSIIAAHKSAREMVSFMKSDLKKAGVAEIESMSTLMSIYDAETDELIAEFPMSHIGESLGTLIAPELSEGVIYSDDRIEVSAKNLVIDNLGDSKMNLSLHNIGAKEYYYSFKELRVNGVAVQAKTGSGSMLDYDSLVLISPSETYDTVLSFGREDLINAGISQIETMDIDIDLIEGINVIDITLNVPFTDEASTSVSLTPETPAPELSANATDYLNSSYVLHTADSQTVLLYEVFNPNDVDISLTVDVAFKDDDGNVIDTASDSIGYIGNGCYNFMAFHTKSSPTNYTVTTHAKPFTNTKANLTINVDDSQAGKLNILVTNNGNSVSRNTRVFLVYIKNGTICGYGCGLNGKRIIDIPAGETYSETFSGDYDKYRFYVTGYYD